MTSEQTPAPLTCHLSAMTPIQRQRHTKLIEQLRHAVKQVKEIPDGYGFRFESKPALFLSAAEFITLESRCCCFYHFRLDQEPENGPMWLFVTGPKEAKSFIKLALAPS